MVDEIRTDIVYLGFTRKIREGELRYFEMHYTSLRTFLMGIIENNCKICHRSTWDKKPIAFEIDHIVPGKGNHPLNVRKLCPNCHKQLPTSNTRRDASTNKQITMEILDEMIEVYKDAAAIGRTLQEFGYERGTYARGVREKLSAYIKQLGLPIKKGNMRIDNYDECSNDGKRLALSWVEQGLAMLPIGTEIRKHNFF